VLFYRVFNYLADLNYQYDGTVANFSMISRRVADAIKRRTAWPWKESYARRLPASSGTTMRILILTRPLPPRAASSALDDAASLVLVSETEGFLSGFLTAKKLTAKTWEILLNGVTPEFQRRGIYAALFREIGCRARLQGASEVLVSTQLANLAPQKVWTRAGLALDHALYTFHWRKA
jgi:GNAT superfamily N-acetyltransferase